MTNTRENNKKIKPLLSVEASSTTCSWKFESGYGKYSTCLRFIFSKNNDIPISDIDLFKSDRKQLKFSQNKTRI